MAMQDHEEGKASYRAEFPLNNNALVFGKSHIPLPEGQQQKYDIS
jgi:hypothetical protein